MQKKNFNQDMLEEVLIKVVRKCPTEMGNFEQVVKEVRM